MIFEVFNEPIFQLWNTTIKPYHEELVQAFIGLKGFRVSGLGPYHEELVQAFVM